MHDAHLDTADPRRERSAGALRRFVATENSGAVVLLLATLAALVWANSPWRASYEALWATEAGLHVGPVDLVHSLRDWVNEGLMAIFFFVAGLEIRREFDVGDLRERRPVAAPVIAALGGMIVPALIFVALNAGSDSVRGWGIVVGTDTAFALGVLSLSRGVSARARTFLLTLVVHVRPWVAVGRFRRHEQAHFPGEDRTQATVRVALPSSRADRLEHLHAPAQDCGRPVAGIPQRVSHHSSRP